jgi:hypothetical protein
MATARRNFLSHLLTPLQRALVCALVLLTGCSYIPIAGGELEGTVMPAPASWPQVAMTKVIELETNPAQPYSVKLWVIAMGSSLYVHAGANHTTWVENIEQNPHVRILIEESIYELEAARVTAADEFGRFSDSYEKKYGRRPRNENITEVYLFRLQAPEYKAETG